MRFGLMTTGLLFLSLTAHVSSALAESKACDPARDDDPVIAAFRESEVVRDKIAKFPSEHWDTGCVFTIGIGSQCGVAGCSSSFLIGQGFTSKGVNPRSVTVLATAHSDPRDWSRISSPRLVTLAPDNSIIALSAWNTHCSANDLPGSETTAGQQACLETKVNSQQQWLDNILRRVRATMTPGGHPLDPEWSEERSALFEESQATWEKYRKTTCNAAYHETSPGSFAPLERLDCLYTLTSARVQELEKLYFSLD